MKYIKSYEQHSFSKVNESIIPGGDKRPWLKAIKNLPFLPLTTLAIVTINLLNPRLITKGTIDKYLPIYNNIDQIKEIINNMIDEKSKYDLTDSEIRKAKKILSELEIVKKKYPTLEDYKEKLKKVMPIFNIRNISYLKRKIDEYEPSKMTSDELENLIKKISKKASDNFSHQRWLDSMKDRMER